MDYSKFVHAVVEDDADQLNDLVPVITAVLIKFLMVRMDARLVDAQDAAQSTLMYVTQKIRQGKVDDPERIIYYMFTTSKNEYLKSVSKVKEPTFDVIPRTHIQPGDQLHRILNKERMKLLETCLESLKPDLKEFIEYWFDNPADEARNVADHFGISVNNAWTKKHRILKLLKECVEKKLNF